MKDVTPLPDYAGSNRIIHTWLAARNQLISSYLELAEALRGNAKEALIQLKLDGFCGLLLDYVSAGHFEVYAEFQDFDFCSKQQHASRTRLLQLIFANTGAMLRFNDLHEDSSSKTVARAQLRGQLSQLGELLVNRFEWEDKLLAVPQRGARAA